MNQAGAESERHLRERCLQMGATECGTEESEIRMFSCKHRKLLLLKAKSRKRCRHCHLTITAEELGGGYCPECFETQGKKRYDFEDAVEEGAENTGYRCEECGALIE